MTKHPAHKTSSRPAPDAAHDGGPARVLVKGKVPWDEAREFVPMDPFRNARTESSGPDAGTPGPKHRDSEPLKRKELASMAKRTNTVLRKPKNATAAFVLSLCWSGLGNAYCGQTGIGALLMLVGGVCWIMVGFGEYDMLWAGALLGFLSAAMAHKQAELHNRHIATAEAAARRQRGEARLDMEESIRRSRNLEAEQRR